MTIGIRQVERIASLLRLGLSDPEKRELAQQLESILSHMEALNRLGPGEPSGAEGQPPSVLREDVVAFDPLVRPPAETAPAWKDGFFIVPRVAGVDPREPG